MKNPVIAEPRTDVSASPHRIPPEARGLEREGPSHRRLRPRWRRIAMDLAYLYRLRSYETLVPGQRVLLFTLFGYAIAAQWNVPLLAVNLAVIGLLFMFFGFLDNYWDWRLLGEQNGTSVVIERWSLSRMGQRWLVLAPWLLMVPFLHLARALGLSGLSELTFWSMTALGLAYVMPGLRLKHRRLSFFIAPIWACLLFLQGFLITGAGPWNPSVPLLCAAVFGLQCQAELLHRLDDHLHQAGEGREEIIQALLWRLRWLPKGSLVVSLLAAWLNPVFLNTSCWSLVRWRAIERVTLDQISRLRRQLWHPVWSLYEFAIYAVLGAFRWLT